MCRGMILQLRLRPPGSRPPRESASVAVTDCTHTPRSPVCAHAQSPLRRRRSCMPPGHRGDVAGMTLPPPRSLRRTRETKDACQCRHGHATAGGVVAAPSRLPVARPPAASVALGPSLGWLRIVPSTNLGRHASGNDAKCHGTTTQPRAGTAAEDHDGEQPHATAYEKDYGGRYHILPVTTIAATSVHTRTTCRPVSLAPLHCALLPMAGHVERRDLTHG